MYIRTLEIFLMNIAQCAVANAELKRKKKKKTSLV